jgi:hypothetical protein
VLLTPTTKVTNNVGCNYKKGLMDKIDIFGKIFVGGGFCFCGFFCFYMFVKNYFKAKASMNWNRTNGIIIESYFFQRMSGDDQILDYKLKYQFDILGNTYIGNKLYFRTMDGDHVNYEKKYFPGKEIIVYYNPKNIKESVLEPGVSSNIYILMLIGFFAFSIGLLIMMFA